MEEIRKRYSKRSSGSRGSRARDGSENASDTKTNSKVSLKN